MQAHFDIQEVYLDFSGISFLQPFQLVYIGCICEQCMLYGYRFSCINLAPQIADYLRRIRFHDYWQNDFNRQRYTGNTLSSALCLWNISQPMIEGYADYAVNYFERNHFNNKELFPISTILKETFNNIFDHAKSDISGYTFQQYFPRKNSLQISICDFGIGIPNSINAFRFVGNQSILPDSDALRLSVQKGISVASIPQNRGWGLDTIREQVRAMSGSLAIRSNGAFYYFDSTVEHAVPASHFKGTLIDIELKTLQLEEVEQEEETNFW